MHVSKETGCFHERWWSPPHMHYLNIQRSFLWRKLSQLSTLSGNLRCTVNGVGTSENPMKLKQNTFATQIPWNLALGYTILQSSDSNQHQYVDHFPNAPKHRYNPSLYPILNHELGRRANKATSLISNTRPHKTRSTETGDLEIRG